jgi:hypothetical protein
VVTAPTELQYFQDDPATIGVALRAHGLNSGLRPASHRLRPLLALEPALDPGEDRAVRH